jgi:hypothetical protein
MNSITFTKNQAVILAILGCISISIGSNQAGYIADIFLVFGGILVCAALITPTPEKTDHE